MMANANKKLLFLCLLLLGCALTGLLADQLPAAGPDTGVLPVLAERPAAPAARMQVYVSGAVQLPGVYELAAGERAADAIAAAGGATAAADLARVNLAQKLKDGSQVHVPLLKAAQQHQAAVNGRKQGQAAVAGSSKRIAREAEPAIQSSARQAPLKININTATAAELTALPGIGPALAHRIVAYRGQRRFTRPEELLAVPGIGQEKFARLRERITIQ